MSKSYVVMKDEKEIETLKTLAAAKKLAETENADVYCNGELVYNAAGISDDEPSVDNELYNRTEHDDDQLDDKYDVVENEAEPVSATRKYKLLNLMNVRKEPSMLAIVIKTLPSGTVVEVNELKDDWLYLTDGSYILYCGGKFAEQV